MATTSRVSLLLLLCVLPAMVAAIRLERKLFSVQGRVYCDTCLAGFDTSATTYIVGAEVVVECKDRNTSQVLYSKKGMTESSGSYKIMVDQDLAHQICEAKLVSSPHSNCKQPILTTANIINGTIINIVSINNNTMTFMNKDHPLFNCTHILN